MDSRFASWLSLDEATTASGAMQIVRGSHRRGVLNAGHFADEETMAQFPPEAIIDLEVQPGECVLLHNLLLHRSGVNRSGAPRRAISVAYIDARSQYLDGEPDPAGPRPHGASEMVGGRFPVLFRAEPEASRGGSLARESGARL